jgi:hypothetical protein
MAVLLVASAIGTYLWLSTPAFDTEPLEELLDIFEEKTRSMHRGRFNYPLPNIENGRAEIDYLQDLGKLLRGPYVDCRQTGKDLQKRYSQYRESAGASIFRPAAWVQKRREGADFVQSTSHQIESAPFTLQRRVYVQPEDVNERYKILKEKSDKLDLVTRAPAAMRRLIDYAPKYAEECPEEAETLEAALFYYAVNKAD